MPLDKASPMRMAITEFPTPDLKDVVVMEEVDQKLFDANPSKYALEAKHPEAKRYPNHFVAAVSPRGYGSEGGVKVYYLKARDNQQAYNFRQVNKKDHEWPRLIQWWVIQRKNYNSNVAGWAAPPSSIGGTWTYMDHEMRATGDEVFDTLFVLVLAEWWDISAKLRGAQVRDDTGEVFPTLRSVVLASDSKASGAAVSATGAASRVTPINAKWVMVEEFVEPTLVTGQQFVDFEFLPAVGKTVATYRRIVGVGTTVSNEITDEGVYQESRQLTLAKREIVTRTLGEAELDLEWWDERAFAWPPVLKEFEWVDYPRGNEGFEWDLKDYYGLTKVKLKRYWTKVAPTEAMLSSVQMIPVGIRWGGRGAFVLQPCLHDDVTITESMTTGGITNVHTRVYEATNVLDWPDSITRLDQVTPMAGGYLVTLAEYFKPDA